MTALITAAALAWGTSTAALTPCRDADACVTVINQLSGSPDVVDGFLTLDGLTVAIHVEMGPGDLPDTVTVTAPRGFRVDPQTVTIPEGGSARIRVFFPLMG